MPPTCSEVVPEQLRSTVYAFDRSFEGAIGATAAPLVGALLSQHLAACTLAGLGFMGAWTPQHASRVLLPCAGLVAERAFGFQGSLAAAAVPNQALQQANAHALGNSLLILLLIPWGLDFIFYCGDLIPSKACACLWSRVHAAGGLM